MNNLSFFLYFAEVVDNLGTVFLTAAILTGMSCGVAIMGHALLWDSYGWEKAQVWRKFLKFSLPTLVVLSIITSFLPSKQTMYLIAASEMTEIAAETETARNLMKRIETALDSFLTVPKENKE